MASAASFAVDAALPLLVTAMKPAGSLIAWIAATSLVFLAALGVLAARAGGANPLVSAWRVTFWGGLALGITAGVGKLFGAAVRPAPRAHSCLNASIGSIRAARRAGKYPNSTPMPAENSNESALMVGSNE